MGHSRLRDFWCQVIGLYCQLKTGNWQLAADGRVGLYEAKSLDGDTLRAIAETLFGVNVHS
jgi:hypothetical protein